MKNWVILTFLYAVCTGFFQCAKKKSIEKSSIYEVLAWFSSIAFVLTAITSKNVFNIEFIWLFVIIIKSIIIVVAWLLSLYALDKMTVSLYGVVNLSRIIFSIALSIIFLGERITFNLLLGMIIVIIGLVLVNTKTAEKEKREASIKTLVILLASCLLNSISAIIDKIILVEITSGQLQFWFLLFLAISYWCILICRKEKTSFKVVKNNYWIIITAICVTLGDRILFMANEIAESKVSIMTIIKQFSAIEIVVLGKFMFKEKNIIKKLLCCILVIIGIVITLI